MTKQELLSTYTAEQLAEMVEKLDNENTDLKEEILKKTGLCGEAKVSLGLHGLECCCGGYDIAVKKNKELQSEVEKYRKAFEDAKKERDQRVCEHQKNIEELQQGLDRHKTAVKYSEEYVDSLKKGINRSKNTINQIDDILEKLFGVRHDTVERPDKFEKILADRAKGNVADFLPTEPIKVADLLINAQGEYEHNSLEKVFCGTDKGTYRIFDVSELRQIAEHLLVYCNNQKENVNE